MESEREIRESNRLVLLIHSLERIQYASTSCAVETAMIEFTGDLLQIKLRRVPTFIRCDETILAFLCYQYGGFHVVLDVMRSFREIEYIQVIGIAALRILWRHNFGVPETCCLEKIVLRECVHAMEMHSEDPLLYTVACSALKTLFGPGSNAATPQHCKYGEQVEDLFHRAVDVICFGLVVLVDDSMSLYVGKSLLVGVIGSRDIADEMIARAEEGAIGSKICAPAA